MKKIWVFIPNFEDYQVNQLGEVRSLKFNKNITLKPRNNGCGYFKVSLSKNKKIFQKLIHRLVAELFIPNPNNLPLVNHKDEDPSNNNRSNLEWCTSKYNSNYGTCKIKKSKPVMCVETGIIYQSCIEAARQTGLYEPNINSVCNGNLKTTGGFHWTFI